MNKSELKAKCKELIRAGKKEEALALRNAGEEVKVPERRVRKRVKKNE